MRPVEKTRVLVVDDEPMVREILTRYFEREGFEVDEASDGRLALERIAGSEPDLVLLDLMLPEIDGYEVFRRLKASSSSKIGRAHV